MSYREKYPDYDPATMPPWPEGAEDISEGFPDMIAPMFTFKGWNFQIDYADPEMREHGDELPRFSVWGEWGEELFSTDAWDEVLAFCAQCGDKPDWGTWGEDRKVKVFTIAHIPEDLRQGWLQHLRDFDTDHPNCHFEVAIDAPDHSLAEMVEELRLNPALTFQQIFDRKRP